MSSPRVETEAARMSATAVSVGPGMPVDEALHLMADRSIGTLSVVQDGRVIGILTQSDVVAALARRRSR
jgi:CBS domain-containing protein